MQRKCNNWNRRFKFVGSKSQPHSQHIRNIFVSFSLQIILLWQAVVKSTRMPSNKPAPEENTEENMNQNKLAQQEVVLVAE